MASSAPSTATVLEFRCLFTHDLRRKQKRWQDGRLKYHTFNARVMVYDERGNSVGDMHWHGEYDFGEGEEVQLDRGGVIVQVEDLVERKETDLSELVDKRVQEKQQRQMQQLARSGVSAAVLPRSLPRPPAVATDRAQPSRHRPLHHVIGTPTGHHGKALVPKDSPFEQRKQGAESPAERTAKRRKYDEPPSKSGYASALFGQTLTLSATPSSSVPATRRQRPEARSDPPPETDAQYPRTDTEPVRREQPRSSRRLNQSGYAQSLFGPNLTLSHTPLISVPSRPQPTNESQKTVDEKTHETSGIVQGALPQQLNESQLDQLGSNSRPTLLRTHSKISNRLAKGSTDTDKTKGHASLSRQHYATNNVQTIPESVGIVEIDDPEPTAPPPVRQSRTQRVNPASLRHSEETSIISKGAARETQVSPEGLVHLGRQTKSKKAENMANGTNASSGRTDAAAQGNITRAPDVSRDPALPVTELRIKSRKKRGLMMISDTSKPKKTRGKIPENSARPFDWGSTNRSRDPGNDDPFHQSSSPRLPSKFGSGHSGGEKSNAPIMASRHTSSNGDEDDGYQDYPVLDRDGEWEKDGVVSELEKQAAQRTISTELGADDDPFLSQPLAISEQTYDRPEPATGNIDKQLGQEATEQAKVTAQNASGASLCFVGKATREPADVLQPTKRPLSSPKTGYDPYQIPSSPRASSPGTSSSAQRTVREHEAGVEILRPMNNDKKLSKAKRQRQTRRKVIAEEDYKDDVDPAALRPRSTGSGSDFEPGAISVLCEEAADKQPKTRKATETRAQRDTPTVESGDEWPKRVTRKPKHQQKELGICSEEDELPIVRRQSRRQRRPRPSSEEPSPLPSEQDDSEEEDVPSKRRKTKAPNASEDRPRLERIKKNVKSRELVGFNLAALNAPLGLRGIGMPFSILPSPVNVSIQEQVSSRDVGYENRSSVVVGGCDDQMLPYSPNLLAAPPKRNAQAQQKSLSAISERGGTGNIPRDSSNSPGENGELVKPDGLANPELPETRHSSKWDGPGAGLHSTETTQNKQTTGQGPSLKQSKTPHESFPSKPSLEAQQFHGTVSTLQGIVTVASATQTFSGMGQPAQKPSPVLSRQSSTVAKHTTSDKASLEAPTEIVPNAQRSSAPAQTTNTEPTISAGILLREKSSADGQQPSSASTGGVKRASVKDPVAADRPPNFTANSQAVTSRNQEKPGMQKQPPILESAQASDTVGSHPNVEADTFTATSAMDDPDPVLNLHSMTTGDQATVTIETAVGNADSDRASALPVRPPNAIGLRRQASAPRSINNIGAKFTSQAGDTEHPTSDIHSKPASNARLANPASRGRKAALSSHAAGPVPQRLLPPTQPVMMVPISTADLEMTPIEQAPKEPERPKKKITFPGFQSARSDGPWSREAFDLLESGRPE